MLDASPASDLHEQKRYQVTVGHITVVVQASDERTAVQLARNFFANDLPRLWDVIHAMEDSRFKVVPLPNAA